MTATIRTELKDNSKEWAENLRARMTAAGVSADKLGTHLNALQDELDSREAQKFKDEVKEIADAIEKEASPATRRLEDDFIRLQKEVLDTRHDLTMLDKAAYEAAQHAGMLDNYIEDLHQSMQSKAVANYKREVDALADSIVNGPKQATAANWWTEFASKLTVVKAGFEVLKWAAQGAVSAVSGLAEAGVPAFQRLAASGNRLKDALIDIAGNPTLQLWIDKLASAADSGGQSTIEWFAKDTERFINSKVDEFRAIKGVLIEAAEAIGLMDQGSLDKYIDEMAELSVQDDKKRKEFEKQNKARIEERERQRKEAIDNLSDPGSQIRKDESKKQELAGITEVADVEARIASEREAQEKRIKAIQKEGLDPLQNREVLESQKELVALEQRRLEIIKEKADIEQQEREQQAQVDQQAADLAVAAQELEHATKMRDMFEKTSQALGESSSDYKYFKELEEQVYKKEEQYLSLLKGPVKDEEERRIKRARDLREEERQAAEERLKATELEKKAAEEAHRIKMQDAQQEIDKFKAFVEQNLPGFMGGGGFSGGPGGGFGGSFGGFPGGSKPSSGGGGLSPQDLMLLQRFRVEDALKQFEQEDKVKGKYKQDSKGNILKGPDGKPVLQVLNKGAREAQRQRNIARVKRETRMQFRRDAQQGNISNQEMAKAGAKLREAAVNKLKQDGNVNQAEANLLQGLVDGLNEAAAQQAEMADQLNMILGGLGMPGMKKGKPNKGFKAQKAVP